MRYLGIYLSNNLSMTKHLEIVCERATRVGYGFRSLLPNLHGPTFMRRKLLINAIMSIIFYAVVVWQSAIDLEKNVATLTKTLRPLRRSIVPGYVTCSNTSQELLSGILPATQIHYSIYHPYHNIHIHYTNIFRDRTKNTLVPMYK